MKSCLPIGVDDKFLNIFFDLEFCHKGSSDKLFAHIFLDSTVIFEVFIEVFTGSLCGIAINFLYKNES
jgi:hypothetical protein